MGNNLETIKDTASKIGRDFDAEKVILFGSHAWGEPKEDSDVDFMVLKETDDKRQEARKIRGSIYPRPFPMDLLVYTPSEVDEKIKKDRNLFLKNVMNKGKVLYEKN